MTPQGTPTGWDSVVEAIPLALCTVDAAGHLERGNRAFFELVGVTFDAAIGQPWTEVIPAEWREGVHAALAAPTPGEIVLRLRTRAIGVTAFPLGSRPEDGAVLLFEDQTEWRGLQDRLIQSEKLSAIGQLIAGVAHDLNNPLTSVVGFADFLAEAADTPPRIREPLRVVQQEAQRASKIVKNLLGFARRQHSRQRAGLQPILEATVGLFRNQLSSQAVTLELALEAGLPDLDLNPNQVQQVFVNLIQNAAHAIAATGRAGTIRVHARRWMDGVAVDVSDDGAGMAPDVVARIFEPFFTTKPEGQGTGLGLSICQGIAKEHGGRISVVTAPGQGSTFTVELPGRVSETVQPAPPESGGPGRPLRVLVVDDEPHILHYLSATLEAWGHAVVTAIDGQAGLERAVAEPFDLIISDLRMPRVGGQQFFADLTRQAPAAVQRLAFTTGDTVRGDTLTFLEASGRPCLHKPFSLTELRALLRDAARDT